MTIEMANPNDGKFYENANSETGENCVLISRAEVDRRRVEFALMYEALEAAEDALATVATIAGPPAFRDVLAKVRAALGRTE